MQKIKIIVLFVILVSQNSYAQYYANKPKLWQLTEFSGFLELRTRYAQTNFADAMLYTGRLNVNTISYVYHPDFITFKLKAGYSPIKNISKFIAQPEYTTEQKNKFISFQTEMLKRKKFSINFGLNASEGFVNRENYSNSLNKAKGYGFDMQYKIKGQPLVFQYSQRESTNKDLERESELFRSQETFKLSARNDFKGTYYTKLILSKKNYLNKYSTYLSAFDYSVNRIRLNGRGNFMDNKIRTTSNIDFRNYSRKKISTNSAFSLVNQIRTEVSKKINVFGTFSFLKSSSDRAKIRSYNLNGMLTHHLYKSLISNLSVGYNNGKTEFSSKKMNNLKLQILYRKKIPLNGNFNISANLIRSANNTKSKLTYNFIENEVIRISDSDIIFLPVAGVQLESVVIKDTDGVFVFQEGIDYVLIERDNFIEIQRIPGGMIEDESSVLVDYSYMQPNSHKLVTNSNNFSAGLTFFDGKFDMYYATGKQSFDNEENMIYDVENFYRTERYGARMNLGFFEASVFHSKKRSKLVPHELFQYDLKLHGNILYKLSYFLNYKVRDYTMIQEEGMKQFNRNFSGNLSYSISSLSKLLLTLGHNSYKIEDKFRSWTSGSLKFNTRYRELSIGAGLNFYTRETRSNDINFIGAQIRLRREF